MRSTRHEARNARAGSATSAGACALALALACVLVAGCVATPLPDPPSFDGSRVMLTDDLGSGLLRLVGAPGTVTPVGTTLRFTVAPRAGVVVATEADGSFRRVIAASAGETLFVEAVLADRDEYAGAFVLTPPSLGVTGPGPDTDGDRSPDAVDCAPGDPAYTSRHCPADTPCASSADCASGACIEGGCALICTRTPETCNGSDDDCNGTVDDGFDVLTDVLNCGACGIPCDDANPVTVDACVAGVCQST